MRLFEQAEHVSSNELHRLYAYPPELDRPWVRLNFVCSIDGAVTVDGRAAGLATPADQQVYGVLRDLADVVLVGAGTARAENYGGAKPTVARPVPPQIAVVSASAALDPGSRLFTDTTVAPLVLSCAGGRQTSRLRAAGAEVAELGHGPASGGDIIAALSARGLTRVLCEGGPSLAGQLLSEDLVDELCLTISPLLVSGPAGRIAHSLNAVRSQMRLARLISADDGTLLSRWVRQGGTGPG